MQYKHLFFDLDHTLWDFDTNSKITMQQLYQNHQLTNLGIHQFEDFYTKYHFHNARLWDRYTKGFIKQEDLRWKRMWLTLLDFKIANEPLARQLSVEYLNLLPLQKTVFPYCFEILDYLTQKTYQLHLITNGFESVQQKKLEHSGLAKYFQQVITSEASNSVKPNKEIFDFAMSKAGATPEQSIMIGDNLEADIQGAINAGIDSVFVNHLDITGAIQPTYTVFALDELKQIF